MLIASSMLKLNGNSNLGSTFIDNIDVYNVYSVINIEN